MTTTKKNAVRFTVDFINKKIVGTKTNFNRASKGNGPAYDELTAKMARHPDFELLVKETKNGPAKAKRTYNGLDFAFMEAYISIQKNAEQIKKEYEAIKQEAEDSGISIYPFTKKWFLGEFDPDGLGFDMEKAKKDIADYRIAKAVLGVALAPNAQDDSQTAEQDENVD